MSGSHLVAKCISEGAGIIASQPITISIIAVTSVAPLALATAASTRDPSTRHELCADLTTRVVGQLVPVAARRRIPVAKLPVPCTWVSPFRKTSPQS